MSSPNQIIRLAVVLLACCLFGTVHAQQSDTIVKTERFDKDPGWDAYQNRITPPKIPVIKQDFGYRTSNFAGDEKGEIGGRIQRSSLPAYFVDKIKPRTLEDKLSASGTFALKALDGGSGGLILGWLNSKALSGAGDPSSFGMLMIFERDGGRISVRLHNQLNQTCGTFVTPYVPGRYRPTPIKPDGTRYRWTLDYDPQANNGDGQLRATVKKVDPSLPRDDFEGLVYTANLRPGFKKEGATFDRFGVTNARKTGGAAEIYFSDLRYDEKGENPLTVPTSWQGFGNQGEFKELLQPGAHDFGYSPTTHFAGGESGEAGGAFWRNGETFGYYADRVGPLSLNDRLEAGGKVVLNSGALDSDMALGWFSSSSKDKSPTDANFLGVRVGGPTRKGHMFSPGCSTAKGSDDRSEGPPLVQGQPYDWSLIYTPGGNDGSGSITLSLGKQSVTLNLKPGHKQEGASFDRFGLFTVKPGGNLVQLYVDDLRYTASRSTKTP